MYTISQRTHQQSYVTLIPIKKWPAFERQYADTAKNKQRYIAIMSSRLENPSYLIWVAELDGRVVGYTLERKVNKKMVQKKGLFVDPDYHGQGIGEALFRASITSLPKGTQVTLAVIESNTRAKHLYQKFGFSHAGYDLKGFYGARLELLNCKMN